MDEQRVVVVTGGGGGIGAAIAEELGRTGAFVVTMDPIVSVDGATRIAAPERTTAQRIIDAGGAALASDLSVTDVEGVRALFESLVDERGALDAVVNVAGISRPTGFGAGSEQDWDDVLRVHLDGYLNVLRAALPLMVAAGHGQVLGVTSGSGWRPANTGAYGCAKRAVAALTWQIGQMLPTGVTINALSPIAATRMVTGALSRPAAPGGSTPNTGGLSLASMPPAEHLGPIGAYLAGESFSWCTGEVIFSSGAEAALIAPPRLLEVVRTETAGSLRHVIDTVVPAAFASAEAAQTTNGASNPRFPGLFDVTEAGLVPSSDDGPVVIVTDDAGWREAMTEALERRGKRAIEVEALPGATFSEMAAALAAGRAAGPLDAVFVGLFGDEASTAPSTGWSDLLAAHDGIVDGIRTDAGWVRAVADYAIAEGRAVRVVTATAATGAAGRTRAQAAAQLARGARSVKGADVYAFAISVESVDAADRAAVAEFAAHLLCHAEALALSGAELVAAEGWVALRSHPAPAGSLTFGGPSVPAWFDEALRRIVSGRAISFRDGGER